MNTYHTNRWKKKRNFILRQDHYIDQELLRYGRRVPANTVHHIYPVEFYPELKYVNWNLISLSSETHNQMHDRHKNEHGNLTEKGLELQHRYRGEYLAWCREHNLEPHFLN